MSSISYVTAKPKEAHALSRAFNENAGIARKGLLFLLETQEVEDVLRAALNEFRKLIPGIPYIGENNIFMKHIIFASQGLALSRSLSQRDVAVEKIGEILCRMVELRAYKVPWIIRRIAGKVFFSSPAVSRLKSAAEVSGKKEYPGDWVFSFIRGDGADFDFGIDVHECGLMKYFRANGAEDIVPYLCATDFIVSRAIGEGLARTMTIARGGDRCDFRFKKGGK
jgi:hypothetical protein